MNEEGVVTMNTMIETTIKNLRKNNMAGYFVKDKGELLALLESLISKKSLVGSGDSVTLEQMGVFEFLRTGDYIFNDKFKPGLSSKQKRELYLKNFSADTFVTGTNAVSSDGKIFNIDGNGSRVAPMIYGPKQVIIVVGVNKIVPNVEAAIHRARQIAAPLDVIRLKRNAPCAKLGRCMDCHHKDRICNTFTLIARQFVEDRIKVMIVDEELGY